MVKNSPAHAGNIRDPGSIPGSGISPGRGHGSPIKYSFLENPHGLWSLVGYSHKVAKSQTPLKQLSMHAYMFITILSFFNIPIISIHSTLKMQRKILLVYFVLA